MTRARLRAAWWALGAARSVRRQLSSGLPIEQVVVPAVPSLPSEAGRAVGGLLRRSRFSCLVRTVVRQAWFAAHGDRRELVIGVKAPGESFAAHAWLEGDPAGEHEGFRELARRPA